MTEGIADCVQGTANRAEKGRARRGRGRRSGPRRSRPSGGPSSKHGRSIVLPIIGRSSSRRGSGPRRRRRGGSNRRGDRTRRMAAAFATISGAPSELRPINHEVESVDNSQRCTTEMTTRRPSSLHAQCCPGNSIQTRKMPAWSTRMSATRTKSPTEMVHEAPYMRGCADEPIVKEKAKVKHQGPEPTPAKLNCGNAQTHARLGAPRSPIINRAHRSRNNTTQA